MLPRRPAQQRHTGRRCPLQRHDDATSPVGLRALVSRVGPAPAGMRNYEAMDLILVLAGASAVILGVWRGHAVAREAIGLFVTQGDETRRLIDAARPVHERSRVRRSVHAVSVAVAWLLVALYGLYLATVGFEATAA
jgi:hypothetical protein